jgi:hypothetical protein
MIKKKKEPEKPKFRVFFKGTNKTPYLPVGDGLPEEEAHRLSDGLKAETEVRCVWEPPEEEQ